jgi:branched-chain amino acid transport system ATP-binding protein
MTTPLLRGSNLQVRYRNGALGVHDVTLEVQPGQTVALLGPNGAGKSTTLRALSGHLSSEGTRVIQGTVQFDGRDVTNAEPHRVARLGMMLVPERRKVFPNLSVMENLLALGSSGGRQQSSLLENVFELFPMLQQRRSEYAGRLSGGQQQMLAIGRSLMSEAKLLLLDELTLGLHVSLKPVLYDAVIKINERGTAVLVADESADFALSVCEYCYVIRDGLISKEGEPAHFELAELAAGYLG